MTSRSTPARRSRCAAGSRRSTREHTGKPVDEISEAIERDRFLTPEEAREFGLIDRIMNGRSPNGH